MKIDTHIHSKYSKDSIMPLEDIIRCSHEKNLKAIAISDHDEIGAIEAIKHVEHDGIIVIPAEEVSTSEGHIVALGITEYIKPLQTPEETIDQIHDNGAIAIAAHPYCFYRSGVGSMVTGLDIDAIETRNSRYILGFSNYRAKKTSEKYDIPPIGSSDAHFIEGIGSCYTQIPEAYDVEEVLKYIKKGKTSAHGIRTPMKAIIREVIRKKGHRTKPKTE